MGQENKIRTELLSFGFNKIQADIYEKFIITVLDALFVAEKSIKKEENWRKILAKEGALLKPRTINGLQVYPPAEEAITAELHVQLDLIKLHANDTHALRQLDIEFRLDPPTPSEQKTGKKSKRPDLVAKTMHYSIKGVEIMFEAKNIYSQANLKNHYFGKQGTQCFTRKEESYRRNKLGAMIGYTIEQSATDWLKEINKIVNVQTDNKKLTKEISLSNKQILVTDLMIEDQNSEYVKLFHMVMKFNALEYAKE